MSKNPTGLMLALISLFYLSIDNLLAHGGHNNKSKRPAIGVVQGSVTDSITGSPIEYASISIIDNDDGSVITGGLSRKDGSFQI